MVMVEWVGLLLVLWIFLCPIQSQHRIEAFFVSTTFPTAIIESSFTKIHVDYRYHQSSCATCSSITDHKHTDSIQTNPTNSTTTNTDIHNDSIMYTNSSIAATAVPVVTDDGYDDTYNENKNYNINNDDTDYGYNDLYARSIFGTKSYWDELYIGHGDFPANTYSWYTDWNQLQYYVKQHLPTTTPSSSTSTSPRIFIPGIGNDSLLVDMILAKYNHKYKIIVQDYSHYALERQIELLQSIDCTQYQYIPLNDTTIKNDNNLLKSSSPPMSIQNSNTNMIELYCFDITKRLPSTKWDESFHMIIEKGLLDAVYLSDETNSNIQNAIHNLYTILKRNGILISISSVVPNELRKLYFPTSTTATRNITNTTNQQQPQILWKWIRDGSTDPTKAGCFIFQKLQ